MSKGRVTIRLADASDREEVAALFLAIERHYFGDAAPSPADMRRHVSDQVLAPDSNCELAIAERNGVAVGLTTFVVVYPAPELSGQLYMKDLFVLPEARGGKVGQAILQWLAGVARDRGCSRVDWTAERDNPAALAFYDRLGVPRVEEKVYFRLDGERLQRFAEASTASDWAPSR